MATNYSLVVWGGSTGKSVTVSSSTDLVTLTDHGLYSGTGVAFTSGTLPSVSGAALALNTTYYAKNISSSTFELYYDSGLTSKIDFTSTGSGLVLKSAYYLGLADTSRWGARIFDGIVSFQTARAAAASSSDFEVCEVGEAFTDRYNASMTFSSPAAQTVITSMVNGSRSSAFHNGVYGTGYVFKPNTTASSGARHEFNGIHITQNNTSGTVVNASTPYGVTVERCILEGAGGTTYGISFANASCRFVNNLILNCSVGIFLATGGAGSYVANNIVTKCGYGFRSNSDVTTGRLGFYYNNIAIGNTTNWGTEPTSFEGVGYNAGLSTDNPWGGNSVSMATTDFVDYDNNDFRPASSSSPQVDSGLAFYTVPEYDIADDERPNYNNGGSEAYDIGCYEYDHGYGPHPSSVTLDFPGVVSTSEIRVYKVSDGTEIAGVESCDADHAFSLTYTGSVACVIRIIHPSYKIKEFNYTITDGDQSIPIQQELDKWYSNPA